MKVLVLLFLSLFVTDIKPTCLDSATPELRQAIETTKIKIDAILKTMEDSIGSTRALIRENILIAKNLTTHKHATTKGVLNKAKLDNSFSKSCVMTQMFDFAKIKPKRFMKCRCDLAAALDIINKMLILKRVASNLVGTCCQLNPLESEKMNFRICVQTKIKQLKAESDSFEAQFLNVIKHAVSNSTDCIMEESGKFYSKLGSIEGAVRSCKKVD